MLDLIHWNRLWFYKKMEPEILGGAGEYRLQHFLALVWILAIFGMIALAFLAHFLRWDTGANTLFAIATAIVGIGGYKFWGDTNTVRQSRRLP